MSGGRAAVVLVHGAWAGGWIWDRVVPLLRDRGIEALTVDLPSCGEGTGPPRGLRADEEAVAAALDEFSGDAVLCGHSYGGMVVTGAARGRRDVRRLVYLCAFMPVEGESLLGAFGGAVPSFWRIRDDLSVVAVFDDAAERATDLGEEDRALLAASRVPQSLTAYTEAPSGIAWRDIPSTYVVCSADAQLPAERQRLLSARATEVVELPTAHHPMLNRPELVAELLAGLAA
jgi:pimeloyl-ACP methyl ester carboxylesterase